MAHTKREVQNRPRKQKRLQAWKALMLASRNPTNQKPNCRRFILVIDLTKNWPDDAEVRRRRIQDEKERRQLANLGVFKTDGINKAVQTDSPALAADELNKLNNCGQPEIISEADYDCESESDFCPPLVSTFIDILQRKIENLF